MQHQDGKGGENKEIKTSSGKLFDQGPSRADKKTLEELLENELDFKIYSIERKMISGRSDGRDVDLFFTFRDPTTIENQKANIKALKTLLENYNATRESRDARVKSDLSNRSRFLSVKIVFRISSDQLRKLEKELRQKQKTAETENTDPSKIATPPGTKA